MGWKDFIIHYPDIEFMEVYKEKHCKALFNVTRRKGVRKKIAGVRKQI